MTIAKRDMGKCIESQGSKFELLFKITSYNGCMFMFNVVSMRYKKVRSNSTGNRGQITDLNKKKTLGDFK